MNRMIRSKLMGLAVILTLSLSVLGCNPCQQCILSFMITFPDMDLLSSWFACTFMAPYCVPQTWMQTLDECAATYEQLQTTAIQLCEEYPEECQKAFDSLVESPDTEAEE